MKLKFCTRCEKEKNAKHFYTGVCSACYKKARQRSKGVKERPVLTDEDRKSYFKTYYEKNRKKYLDKSKRQRLLDPEKYRKYCKEWVKNNSEKSKIYQREYQSKRRGKVRESTFFEHKREIFEIYSNCPEGMEVDHIIPIQGKNVCGLHVPWNLQYLTRTENRKKSNKVLPNNG